MHLINPVPFNTKMKRMSRILEKLHLASPEDAKAGAMRICDIVRGMGPAEDMTCIALIILAICNHPDVIALRMKER